MTPEQVNLVRKSFQEIAPQADAMASAFYRHLFELKPILRLMFPEDLTDQKKKLMATLALAVASLDRFDDLKPALENLGRKHTLYGVKDEYYETVGVALLWTLGELLGDQFTAELETAWTKMYDRVAGTMRRAAREFESAETDFFKIQPISKGETTMRNAIKNASYLVTLIFCLLFCAGAANAAIYTVTSTADTGGSTCAANCTLRQALTASYFDNTGVINFNIPGGGVKTISPLTPLPELGHNIDGTTQPGYSGTPLIELNGANVSSNPSYGLVIKTNATIRGLIINRFATAGIFLDTYVDNNGDTNDPTNMVIKGNYIGTNAAGNAPLGNGYGIYVKAFNGTVAIGGTGANDRNVISGNNLNGINISGCAANQQARIVASVKGNYIGTDVTGSIAVGNILSGVAVNCNDSTIIGGTTAAERNVISGNKGNAGIEILSNDVTIQGNYIGTNAAGNGFLGNTNDGIRISGSEIIGGTSSGAGNVISGNSGNGIKDNGGYQTEIQGNKIGTNALGTAALANSSNGIYVVNGSDDIGGSATITVSRTNGAAGAVSVNYSTANGTATAGQDYTANSGTLILNDGQTSASFNVPILNDAIGEANETAFLSLANPNGGASLGNQTNAVLTINDDDGGLPANVFVGGRILENGSPLPNVLVTLSGSQSKTATTDASGNYNFANLPGGGNYLVTPTFSGHTFEPFNLSYNNLAASVSSANFTATTGTPARLVRVAGGDTVSGNAVVVPIELVSQGNENSVGFSLNYDANLLSNAQVSLGNDAANGSLVVNSQIGKLGVIVALASGQSFAAGTRQVATVTFQTVQTALYSTPVGFGDAPIARETTDANAGVLPTAYADGAVTFAQGYEADVAPRPTGSGNGSVTVADFTMVGKFVAGTLTPDQLNKFQRADCAPRGTKGNGVLTVSDYTQAGRYAAALDAVQTAGGASVANLFRFEESGKLSAESFNLLRGANKAKPFTEVDKLSNQNQAVPRVVRVVSAQTSANSQVLVSIEIETRAATKTVSVLRSITTRINYRVRSSLWERARSARL